MDRRRINGPAGGTAPPIFASDPSFQNEGVRHVIRPNRIRKAPEQRKIFLKTGLTPSASGSAYIELDPSTAASEKSQRSSLIPSASSLKLTCSVHGPRPLPRSAPFTSSILLSTHVKFAPFAARQRRGYVRDASERDLAAHLETALRGVIIGDRWPKSGVDVVVTVLEGEDEGDVDHQQGSGPPGIGGVEGWGMMAVLAGCITAASAAIVDAGIDCVDLVSGGVAALVVDAADTDTDRSDTFQRAKAPSIPRIVLDPSPSEHERIVAACVVGYLSSRDEITEMWMRGEVMQASQGVSKGSPPAPLAEELVDQAVHAACGARLVLAEAVKESASWKLKNGDQPAQPSDNGVKASSEDVVMA